MRRVLTACVVLLVSIAAARGAEKIDLATKDGVAKVKGEWRYANVKIIEVPGRNPDGSANTTYSIEPRAPAPDVDDSKWGGDRSHYASRGPFDRAGLLLLVSHPHHRTAGVEG